MFQFGKKDFVSWLASPDFDEVESLDQLSPLPWREKEGIGLLKVQIPKKEQQVLSMASCLVPHVIAGIKKKKHILLLTKGNTAIFGSFFCKIQKQDNLSM